MGAVSLLTATPTSNTMSRRSVNKHKHKHQQALKASAAPLKQKVAKFWRMKQAMISEAGGGGEANDGEEDSGETKMVPGVGRSM